MLIKLRFSSRTNEKKKGGLRFETKKKFPLLTNSNFSLHFLLYCFTLSYKILFKILKTKLKVKNKTGFSEKKTLNFFLKSLIRIITDFLINFNFSSRFGTSILEYRNLLYTLCHMSNKFLDNGNKFNISQKIFIGEKNSNNKQFKKKLDYFATLKTTSSKKNFLLETDLKQIRFFISENLGKLTSILDINISRQLESVDQISDHSVCTDRNFDKIKKKLKIHQNIKKKFNFYEGKTVFLSCISFLLCHLLF